MDNPFLLFLSFSPSFFLFFFSLKTCMVHKGRKNWPAHMLHIWQRTYTLFCCVLCFLEPVYCDTKARKRYVTVISDYLNLVFRVLQTQPGHGSCGSLYLSGKLPTYPSPKPTFCISEKCLCWLKGGVGGQFSRNI